MVTNTRSDFCLGREKLCRRAYHKSTLALWVKSIVSDRNCGTDRVLPTRDYCAPSEENSRSQRWYSVILRHAPFG